MIFRMLAKISQNKYGISKYADTLLYLKYLIIIYIVIIIKRIIHKNASIFILNVKNMNDQARLIIKFTLYIVSKSSSSLTK